MQTIFENTVERDNELKDLSIKAFQSHTKSYSTHSRDTKYIFHIKNLHLGHVAKSFGLKDTPNTFKETMDDKKDETEEKKEFEKWFQKNSEKTNESKRDILLKEKVQPRKEVVEFRKKMSVEDRLKQHKDFTKGKLVGRKKIVIPEFNKLKKRKFENTKADVNDKVNFSVMLRNPFNQKNNFNLNSEFDSGFQNKKVKKY
jgi:hypothetical protein